MEEGGFRVGKTLVQRKVLGEILESVEKISGEGEDKKMLEVKYSSPKDESDIEPGIFINQDGEPEAAWVSGETPEFNRNRARSYDPSLTFNLFPVDSVPNLAVSSGQNSRKDSFHTKGSFGGEKGPENLAPALSVPNLGEIGGKKISIGSRDPEVLTESSDSILDRSMGLHRDPSSSPDQDNQSQRMTKEKIVSAQELIQELVKRRKNLAEPVEDHSCRSESRLDAESLKDQAYSRVADSVNIKDVSLAGLSVQQIEIIKEHIGQDLSGVFLDGSGSQGFTWWMDKDSEDSDMTVQCNTFLGEFDRFVQKKQETNIEVKP